MKSSEFQFQNGAIDSFYKGLQSSFHFLFQFQNGAIDSATLFFLFVAFFCFNSKMVRLIVRARLWH